MQVADGIFSIDENPAVRADFTTNPNKYAKAIDNYITNTYVPTSQLFASADFIFRLKKQYRAVNERIGKTGTGLKPEDVTPGSEIANIIGMLTLNILRRFLCELNWL